MDANPSHTFLFADLVGFTELTSLYGDDRAADLAVGFSDEVARIAGEHGAQAVKSIGDAVMVRANEAAQAVRLGLRLVGELDRRLAAPPVRVGMNTGPAISRRDDWFGAAVNLAARVAGAARGGEVLMTESTRAALGAGAEVGVADLGLQTFKGFATPLAVYAATERRPAQRRSRRRGLLAGLPIAPSPAPALASAG